MSLNRAAPTVPVHWEPFIHHTHKPLQLPRKRSGGMEKAAPPLANPEFQHALRVLHVKSFHFLSPDQTLFYPKALREDFGKDPSLSQPDLCSEGHREEKMMPEEKRGSVWCSL
uniref:Uncharacterized protein n=1 Tax=Junco hyemalis TaxID=40217 RepID=A0A8C5J6L8_JUNHY